MDSFSGAAGSFGGGYVAGTPTTGPVSWTSASQSGSGSVTFAKTVYVTKGTVETSGRLSDTATVTGSDGFTATAGAKVDISVNTLAAMTIAKSIPDVLQGGETATFTFRVKDSLNQTVATVPLTFAAGETSKAAVVNGLAPGVYTVSEDPATGWENQNPVTVDLSGDKCGGTAAFTNVVRTASAKVRKVTKPTGFEANWTFTLTGTGTPAGGEQVTTSGSGYVTFATKLGEGSYTITETPQPGWQSDGGSAQCSFSVDLPGDADKTFDCTFTNTYQPSVTLTKKGADLSKVGDTFKLTNTSPSGGAAGTPDLACTIAGPDRRAQPAGGPASRPGLHHDGERVHHPGRRDRPVPEQGHRDLYLPGQRRRGRQLRLVMPGWTTTLGPPFYVVYNPSGDNSVVCADFTAAAGQTLTFAIDNTPPPGGLARTIGFWKNWASCANSNGKQKPVLDQTLARSEPAGITIGILTLHGSTTTPDKAPDCAAAVSILNKSDIKTGRKMASDPLYNLAAQLLAAKLDVAAGAGVCGAAVNAINDAQALLAKYKFNGTGTYKITAADATLANNLATTLDKYNNGTLC